MKEGEKSDWGKYLIIVLATGLLFLFALNGRYCRTGADTALMFDKWKKEWIAPDEVIRIAP